jgi:NTE family protein
MTNYKKEQRLKDKEKTEKTSKHEKEVSITSEKQFDKETQRALVFQGGGALAAYEVGVYAVLYFWIKKDLNDNRKDENIFDIIAGTSGGAINAAIIVSHVMQKRNESKDLNLKDSWKGSIKQLLDFYNHISSDADYTKWGPYSTFGEIVQEQVLSLSSSSFSSFSTLPSYSSYYRWRWPPDENSWKSRWDQANRVNKSVATGEAARRYYSAKEYLYSGAPNVFLPSLREYDNRFFDDFVMPTNIWFHFDNTPLKGSINQYAKFPIATSFFPKEKPQPRLLMVSVDVETGAIFTFDSYEKDPQGAATTRKSESDDYTKRGKEIDNENNNKTSINKIEIEYSCGIMVEHIIASSSVPINYNYAEVPISYDKDCRPSENRRKFWDGGTQSNTPLRELIQAHEDYWNKVIDAEKRKEEVVAAATDEDPSLTSIHSQYMASQKWKCLTECNQ